MIIEKKALIITYIILLCTLAIIYSCAHQQQTKKSTINIPPYDVHIIIILQDTKEPINVHMEAGFLNPDMEGINWIRCPGKPKIKVEKDNSSKLIGGVNERYIYRDD